MHVNHAIGYHTQCEKSIEVISHKFVTHFSTNQMQLVLDLQNIELIQYARFDQEVQNHLKHLRLSINEYY